MKKLYEKSEVLFAVLFIVFYVVGNSILQQVSDEMGMEMAATVPLNILLVIILLLFFKKNELNEYYGLKKPEGDKKKVLFYIPMIIISTVNVWFGFVMRKSIGETIIYIVAMILAGTMEELIFRGLLYKAMCRKSVRRAIIVTSILFGMGHIVNLVNGSGMELAENICQLFYAVAIGFLLVSVLYTGKSLIPCIITHAVFNSLSVFANETMFEKVQIPVCIALCVISGVSAALIFKNGKQSEEGMHL